MYRPSLARTLGIAAIAAAAACGDSATSPTERDLTNQESLDVAAVAGDAIAEDVSMMNTQEGALGQPVVDAQWTGPWQSCTFQPSSGRFACPDVTRGGITISRSYQLLDGAGQPQPAYDAATTASATFTSSMTGSVARQRFQATISRQRTITVSGLLGDESTHVINGTGATAATRSRHTEGGISRAYSMSSSLLISDVVVPVPRAAGEWPLSGTITRQVTFTREEARGTGRTGTRTVTVTFNGTQLVPMTVNDIHFTLDLATGTITPAS
ncbi:MAG TPA: hypothetical protein VFS05_07615 [Gemmatimonadaceae bacterium]|nr:hypothetical protein [Gemmatimonadaceae bacterium]